jgi:hypothetical protein
MWLPDAVETNSLAGAPVSFSSDEDTGDAEARALVRLLKAAGVNCTSVTGTDAGQTLHGLELNQWLGMTEIPVKPSRSENEAIPIKRGRVRRSTVPSLRKPTSIRVMKSGAGS